MPSDSVLQQAVLAELGYEPSIDAAYIGVTANNGVITLTGHVGSLGDKLTAETAASRVKGVKAVAGNRGQAGVQHAPVRRRSPKPPSTACAGM